MGHKQASSGRASDRRKLVLVAVVVRLERASFRNADVVGLVLGQRGQLGAELFEVKESDLLVEVLGQGVDLGLVA